MKQWQCLDAMANALLFLVIFILIFKKTFTDEMKSAIIKL